MLTISIQKGKKVYEVTGVDNFTVDNGSVALYFDKPFTEEMASHCQCDLPASIYFFRGGRVVACYQSDLDNTYTPIETLKRLL